LVVSLALLALGSPTPGFAKPPAPTPAPDPAATELTPAQQRIENVITAARVYLGVPYRLGAEGPDLMDCSGLIYRSFTDAGEARRMSGARLGVRSYVRWFAARGALVLDEAEAVRGDLAIWGAGEHMGIYLGDGRAISAVLSGVAVHALRGLPLPLTGFLRPDWNGKGKVEPLDPSLLLDQAETPVALVPASSWAPALDPFAEGAQPERTGAERVDMRTATSRTFENPDGTFTTELHAQPIYYQTADPDAPESTIWAPIDLRFAKVDGVEDQPDSALVSTSSVVVTALPSDTQTGFLTLAAGERALALARVAPADTEAATPVIGTDGRTVDYFDFYGDSVGLRVLARPDGARSFVVLREQPERNQFSFRLASEGLLATAEIDGTVALRDSEDAIVARITKPQLIDSSDVEGNGGGVFTAAASLSVGTAEDGVQTITITVAKRFLDEAVYPAFVDLSLIDFPAAAPGADLAFVSSRHPNSVFVGAERPEQPYYGEAWLGRQPRTRVDNELYLRFDDPRTVIGDADVSDAALELYPYWGSADGAEIDVRATTAVWNAETLSWLTRPLDGEDLGSISMDAGEWTRLDLAEVPANGLALAAAQPGAGSWTRLIARDQSAEIAFGPRLVLTWSGLPPTLGPAETSAGLAPVLAWTNAPVAGAQQRFEVQVSADDFATLVYGSGVVKRDAGAATTWTLPTDSLAIGDYTARVRTRSGEVGWSAWSAPYAFRYGPPLIKPVASLTLETVDSE
jgi:hypothetical protein